MTELVIAIGSNKEREHNIRAALDQLSQAFGALAISPVYKSRAQTPPHQSATQAKPYFNLVVALETDRRLEDIKHLLTDIENQQDRERLSSIVTLDLDILLYGDWVGEFGDNTIPHHDISQCAYVLRPLADLLPDHTHPVYKRNYRTLWAEFTAAEAPAEQLEPVEFVWDNKVISTTCCLPII